MKRTIVLVMTLIMCLFALSCKNENVVNDDKNIEESSEETENPNTQNKSEESKNENTEVSENDTTTKNENIDINQFSNIITENIFLTYDKNLHFEYEITGDGVTAHMSLYMTPDYLRCFVPIEGTEGAVVVFRLKDDTAFMYMMDKSLGGEYTYFPLLNEWQYHTLLIDQSHNVVNLERTKLNDWDVIYGELEYEGGHLVFWYSEIYSIMMKYIINTPEGKEYMYNVTSVEILDSTNPELFEKPSDIQFYDLGEAESFALTDLG